MQSQAALVTQLELLRGIKLDALEWIAQFNGGGGVFGEREKARDHLLGALLLGPESMEWTHGWWRRRTLPFPRTYETVRHSPGCQCARITPEQRAKHTACSEDALDAWICQLVEGVGPGGGWGWERSLEARLPAYHVIVDRKVRKPDRLRGRLRRWRTCDQVHDYADNEFRRSLSDIRDVLEEYTGERRFMTRSVIVNGMRTMSEEWYRACCSLLDCMKE